MRNKNFENRWTNTNLMSNNIFEQGIFYRQENSKEGIPKKLFERKILKILIFYPYSSKAASADTKDLQESHIKYKLSMKIHSQKPKSTISLRMHFKG